MKGNWYFVQFGIRISLNIGLELSSSVSKHWFCMREVPGSSPGADIVLFFVKLLSFTGAVSSNPTGGGSKIAPSQRLSAVISPMPGGLYGNSE